MTGTGIQSDPYIVDNWNDFKMAAVNQNAYVKFADGGGEIDFLKDVSSMSSATVKANVDGNGWTLKNMYADGIIAIHLYGKISNLNFAGFHTVCKYREARFVKLYLNESTGMSSTIENCKFSGVISGKYSNSVFAALIENYGKPSPYQEVISRCSFALKVKGGISINSGNNIVFSNCILDVDSSENDSLYPFYGINFRNCLIMGEYMKLKFPTGFSKNVILDVKCPSTNIISCANAGEMFIGNSDKANYDSTIKVVTSEQLKNAEYLASLDFPVGDGELEVITISDFVQGGFDVNTGAETSWTYQVRSDYIPVNPTAITVECNNFNYMSWHYIGRDANGKFIPDTRNQSLSKYSGDTISLNDYPQISEVRISLNTASGTLSPPQECKLYNGYTWKIDPEKYGGVPYPVLAPDLLDLGAFANATELVEVSIPKSVKKIGRQAFKNTKLKSVTIASDCIYYPTSFPPDCTVNFYPD